mmetsp:Transcript_18056/g.37484  ORF Transcript_18056/g.37484 Transcript_18056/m.37484 type:complete len:204 (+) Transcript_18056:651-1262(+)
MATACLSSLPASSKKKGLPIAVSYRSKTLNTSEVWRPIVSVKGEKPRRTPSERKTNEKHNYEKRRGRDLIENAGIDVSRSGENCRNQNRKRVTPWHRLSCASQTGRGYLADSSALLLSVTFSTGPTYKGSRLLWHALHRIFLAVYSTIPKTPTSPSKMPISLPVRRCLSKNVRYPKWDPTVCLLHTQRHREAFRHPRQAWILR